MITTLAELDLREKAAVATTAAQLLAISGEHHPGAPEAALLTNALVLADSVCGELRSRQKPVASTFNG
jgi:hypothetical protein